MSLLFTAAVSLIFCNSLTPSINLILTLQRLVCKRTYHHNFYVHGGTRTYYGGMPEVIQVAMHYFMDQALLEFFATSQEFAWCAACHISPDIFLIVA